MQVHPIADDAQRAIVVNDTERALQIAGATVPAGEVREFWVRDLVPYLDPQNEAHRPFLPIAEASEAAADPNEDDGNDDDLSEAAAELAAQSVAKIVEQFAQLSDAMLEALDAFEVAMGDAARKTLLEAIAKERLERAQRAGGA